jgi:hypothetical protein
MNMGPSEDLSHDLMQLCQSLNGSTSKPQTMPPVTLYAYFDESGKFHDKEVISFCGWLGSSDNWSSLISGWEELLVKHSVMHLHAAQMKNYGCDLLDFADLVSQKFKGRGFATALDAKHFKNMPQSFREKVGTNPHYMIFRAAVNLLLDAVEEEEKKCSAQDVVISLICDQDAATSSECLRWINKLKQNDSRARRRVASICFADSRKNIPLQAADLLANAARGQVESRTKGDRAPEKLFHALTHRRNRYGQESPTCEGVVLSADVLDALNAGKSPEILEALSWKHEDQPENEKRR